MTEVNLLVDSVSVFSPGGRVLQGELTAALDRTCPENGRAVVLKRPDQSHVGGFSRLDSELVAQRLRTRWHKWDWLRRGLPSWVRRVGPTAVLAAGGMVAPAVHRMCGVVATTNNLTLFFKPSEVPDYTTRAAKLRQLAARYLTVRTLKRADCLVLHSEHALETISRFAGDLRPKTRVVLTGVPHEALLENLPAPPPHPYAGRPYFFYLSAVRWYKNHLRLIEAYRLLARTVDDLPDLLLVGFCKDAQYLEQVEAAISAASLSERIRYLGEVPGNELYSWLHHATVNVFPSLTETNSVIQAEILGQHGVMAASGIAPMTEVADQAAEFFDPRDPGDIARVLERLWRDPGRRLQLRELAARRAAELSWDACGHAFWQAAQTATERHRARRS